MKLKKLIALVCAAMLIFAACGDDKESSTAESDENAAPSEESGTIRLWLNGNDTPDDLVNYAIAEFKKLHPNVQVNFERQQWTGIVERLTTALSSSDSPDVVELGNTQAQAFEAGGALRDLSDKKEELGGDDLVQSLLEAGTYDGKFYAAPYYGGARIVIYRKDLFQQANLKVPTTLDEFIQAGITLKQASPDPAFSGIYFPGKYWYAALPFIWEAGGDIATQKNGEWVGKLATDESIAGLENVKKIIDQANGAPKDADEDPNDYVPFCAGQIGMLMGPGWKWGQILNEKDGCPAMEANLGAFALPGEKAGTTAPVFLGGSNLAISAKSKHPELAYDLLKIMLSEEYQRKLGELGLVPALMSQLPSLSGDDGAVAQSKASANSRFTPSSENWAAVEATTVLPDMLVAIAQGADIEAEAKKADDLIATKLNS